MDSLLDQSASAERAEKDSVVRLLCITDLHGDGDVLRRILQAEDKADLVLLGGDLTNFGSANEAQRLVELAQDFCEHVLAVAGNCDSPAIEARLAQLGVSLFRRGVVARGIGFFGASAMPWWHGGMYEMTEQEIADALAAGRAQVASAERLVLLSHSPPHGTAVDRTRRGDHVGSTAVRDCIRTTAPCLVVCGHIHEAAGIDTLDRSTIVNCGPASQGQFATATLGPRVEVQLRRWADG